MHGLPHDVDRDVTLEEALHHLLALSASQRSITLRIGCLTTTGLLRFIRSLDGGPAAPRGSEASYVFHLGDHSGLVIRTTEFQGGHLWTADGDDYFELSLRLDLPLVFQHHH